MSADSPRKGIALCLVSLIVLAGQDATTKVLAQDFAVAQFVMVRYIVFAVVAVLYLWRRGRLAIAFRARRPWLQVARSLLLVIEIGVFAIAVRHLGLAEMHAIVAVFPLLTTALAVPLLGERVGARRWIGVGIGFLGTLIILRPGFGVFGPEALIALASALLYALYTLFTRLASRDDSFDTGMLYLALVGCIAATPFGIAQWRAPGPGDWALMGLISVTGIAAHLLIMKSLEYAPGVAAAAVQLHPTDLGDAVRPAGVRRLAGRLDRPGRRGGQRQRPLRHRPRAPSRRPARCSSRGPRAIATASEAKPATQELTVWPPPVRSSTMPMTSGAMKAPPKPPRE